MQEPKFKSMYLSSGNLKADVAFEYFMRSEFDASSFMPCKHSAAELKAMQGGRRILAGLELEPVPETDRYAYFTCNLQLPILRRIKHVAEGMEDVLKLFGAYEQAEFFSRENPLIIRVEKNGKGLEFIELMEDCRARYREADNNWGPLRPNRELPVKEDELAKAREFLEAGREAVANYSRFMKETAQGGQPKERTGGKKER